MTKLNHLNMTVADPPAAADFLVKYCGMRVMDNHNRNFIFLTDDNDMVFALMKGKNVSYPDNFHIGFIQPTRGHVDAINERLRADGFDVNPPTHQHAWTFYARIPGAFMVEFLA